MPIKVINVKNNLAIKSSISIVSFLLTNYSFLFMDLFIKYDFEKEPRSQEV